MIDIEAVNIPRAYLRGTQTVDGDLPVGAQHGLGKTAFGSALRGAAGGPTEEEVAGGPVREEGFHDVVVVGGHVVVVVEGVGDGALVVEPEGTADAGGVVALAAAGVVGDGVAGVELEGVDVRVDCAADVDVAGFQGFADDEGGQAFEEGVGFVGEIGQRGDGEASCGGESYEVGYVVVDGRDDLRDASLILLDHCTDLVAD